ncbi:hypothetical protein GALL_114640 [mine drainage metagenome]|uniref:Uncharacterized protein n=1 Tax=mine drainage metagenome TaxID=410659 RepID=A0A1J5SDJ4_9ZZZZ
MQRVPGSVLTRRRRGAEKTDDMSPTIQGAYFPSPDCFPCSASLRLCVSLFRSDLGAVKGQANSDSNP